MPDLAQITEAMRVGDKHRPWTMVELDRLADMFTAGVPYAEIRRALNRGHYSVRGAVRRLRSEGRISAARVSGRPRKRIDDAHECIDVDHECNAEIGSALLRDALLAYYERHVWSVAA
jgi:hypothetical protein